MSGKGAKTMWHLVPDATLPGLYRVIDDGEQPDFTGIDFPENLTPRDTWAIDDHE